MFETLCDDVTYVMVSELLSHTVAEALKKRFPCDEEAKKLAKFIELVNNWFDIMN